MLYELKVSPSLPSFILVQPQSTTLKSNAENDAFFPNTSVILTCNTNARPAADHYKFYYNGELKQESSSNIYKINNTKESDSGSYKCVPVNEVGQGEEAILDITVTGKSIS